MKLADNLESQNPEDVLERDPSYVIDPSKTEGLHRSLSALLAGRRCAECQERLQETGDTTSIEEHVKKIGGCCSKQDGFIRPEMPMQEIIFRVLLSGGNKPAKLSHVHHEVTETWYSPMNPRSISAANLKRVLDDDDYYGFKEVEARQR